jgi:hypothetical protein
MIEVTAYKARVASGGCRVWFCTEAGLSEYAVWWKCNCGFRSERLYCRAHGPEMLKIAVGYRLIDGPHYMWPMIEGAPEWPF